MVDVDGGGWSTCSGSGWSTCSGSGWSTRGGGQRLVVVSSLSLLVVMVVGD